LATEAGGPCGPAPVVGGGGIETPTKQNRRGSLGRRAGRVVATTELRPASPDTAPEFLVVDVPLGRSTASAPTLFARGGWLLVHACQLVAAGLLVLSLRRRRA